VNLENKLEAERVKAGFLEDEKKKLLHSEAGLKAKNEELNNSCNR